MVKTLSGGEMQRATLSRALAQEANLLLLDEPTSSLDFAKTNEFYDLIIQLKKDLKLTIFFLLTISIVLVNILNMSLY